MAKGKKGKEPTVPEDHVRPFSWIPRWGWVLIFLVPLVTSEYMFFRVGKTASMVMFPIAWVAFWITLLQRGGWSILKRRQED